MNWQDILEDIEEEQAVLFIGPELVRLGDRSLGLHVREQLHRESPDDILHHYVRDGIFLFRDDSAKVRAQKKIKRLYKQLPPDEALLQRVAALPFHLVVSLTPDTHLRDVCEACGLQPHFHYFRSGDAPDALPKPERGKPLIYNLVGHIGYDESLVLDYDDMFQLVSDCLKTGLPLRINQQLARASTFVFLGFDFEKWHTQLLLRFLSQRPGISKFAIEGERPDADDTTSFLVQGFKISFEKGEQEGESFFDSLYRRCGERGMLRKLNDPFSGEQTRLLRLAYGGKLATALEALNSDGLTRSQPTTLEEITLLSARLHHLEAEKPRMDTRDYWVEWNKIAYGIVQIIKTIRP